MVELSHDNQMLSENERPECFFKNNRTHAADRVQDFAASKRPLVWETPNPQGLRNRSCGGIEPGRCWKRDDRPTIRAQQVEVSLDYFPRPFQIEVLDQTNTE